METQGNDKFELPAKWQDYPSLVAMVLYIAFAATQGINLPIGISYVVLALAGLYSLLVLYLLVRTIRHKPLASIPQKTYLHLGFRLLVNFVLLYLVAGSIWAF